MLQHAIGVVRGQHDVQHDVMFDLGLRPVAPWRAAALFFMYRTCRAAQVRFVQFSILRIVRAALRETQPADR